MLHIMQKFFNTDMMPHLDNWSYFIWQKCKTLASFCGIRTDLSAAQKL